MPLKNNFYKGLPQKKNLWKGLRFPLATGRENFVRNLPHVAAGRRCRDHKYPAGSVGQKHIQEASAEGAGATAPSFCIIAPGPETWSGPWGADSYNHRRSNLPAPCSKHRDRVFWCACPPLAENQAFVWTTPFSFSFLSEVFSWRLGRRRGWGGGQPAKMKQLMKRKLLNRQIVLSGWGLCSWLCVAREGTVETVFWLMRSCSSQEIALSPAASDAQKLWACVVFFLLPLKKSIYCWWRFYLVTAVFTHCKKCELVLRILQLYAPPRSGISLWQLAPKRSCVSDLVCLTVWKEIWEVEDELPVWVSEGNLKAQAWSGDPNLLWHWLNLLLLLSSSFKKPFRNSWGSGRLVVTLVARVIPGSNIRCVDSLWNREAMAFVLLKVIRHLVQAEAILCCEGKRAKRMYKFLKEEKKRKKWW